MLEEVLKHVANCGRSARRHSLPGTPGVDLLDQLRLDPDVDVCGFPCHAGKLGRRPARRLMNRAKKLLIRANRADSG
jgi:hypothetical protein